MSRKQGAGKISKAITYIVLLMAVVALGGFLAYFTGGFTDDFKTFYVKIEDKDVLSTAEGYTLSTAKPLECEVKYTFSGINQSVSGYSVKVVPNRISGKDFDFTVDGSVYSFQAEDDLTAGFTITEDKDSFVITPKGGLEGILSAVYKDKDVSDCKAMAYENMFSIIISSYNGKSEVRIDFSITDDVSGITLEPEVITF